LKKIDTFAKQPLSLADRVVRVDSEGKGTHSYLRLTTNDDSIQSSSRRNEEAEGKGEIEKGREREDLARVMVFDSNQER
jgi:hypothetical protein